MSAGALLLLLGDDPWLELPLDPNLLQQIAEKGARLEVCAGWPMSADYLQASAAINILLATHQQSSVSLHQEIQRLSQEHAQLENTRLELQSQLNALSHTTRVVQNEKQHLIDELRSAQRERNVFLAQFNHCLLYTSDAADE